MLDEAESTHSVDRWSELNRSFHDTLYRPAERAKLLTLIAGLNAQVERYIRLLVSRSDYRSQAQREHRAILAAAEVGPRSRRADRAARQRNRGAARPLPLILRGADGGIIAGRECRGRGGAAQRDRSGR